MKYPPFCIGILLLAAILVSAEDPKNVEEDSAELKTNDEKELTKLLDGLLDQIAEDPADLDDVAQDPQLGFPPRRIIIIRRRRPIFLDDPDTAYYLTEDVTEDPSLLGGLLPGVTGLVPGLVRGVTGVVPGVTRGVTGLVPGVTRGVTGLVPGLTGGPTGGLLGDPRLQNDPQKAGGRNCRFWCVICRRRGCRRMCLKFCRGKSDPEDFQSYPVSGQWEGPYGDTWGSYRV